MTARPADSSQFFGAVMSSDLANLLKDCKVDEAELNRVLCDEDLIEQLSEEVSADCP